MIRHFAGQPSLKKESAPTGWKSTAAAFAMLVLAGGIFARPALVFDSLLHGLRLAFYSVIPAVFPMMVVSGVIMESPLATWLGLPLSPYLRALGIRERSAATVLFLGLLGGFAVLAQGIDQLYRAKRIDGDQAQLLLCAGLNAGPSFVILSVGYEMLGSLQLGILLLCSLILGNLTAALLLRFFTRPCGKDFCGSTPQAVMDGFPRQGVLGTALSRATSACLTLCGTIAFFSLVCGLTGWLLPGNLAGGVTAVLEVTNGVLAAAQSSSPYRVYLVLAVLSWTGLSIQQQARALLPPQLTLRCFYLSRLFALPLTLIFYAAGLRLFPGALAASSFVLQTSRFSRGILVSFFLMVAAFLYECTPKALYGQAKKEYNK